MTAQGTTIHRDCPSCGAPAATAEDVAYAHPDWPMKKCRECHLVYLEYVPVYNALYDELAWTKQHQKEKARRKQQQPIIQWLDEKTRWRLGMFGDATPAGGLHSWAKPGPVLDVGCGFGKAFLELKDGYIPFGVEIESTAAARANEAYAPKGGKVVNADGVSGIAQFPDGFFTGISMWSYLEHEARPREVLTEARRVLAPGGILLVKVPNYGCWNRSILGAKWSGFRHPDHVQYFTEESLTGLAERTGFSASYRLYGRIPLNDNMYAILRPR